MYTGVQYRSFIEAHLFLLQLSETLRGVALIDYYTERGNLTLLRKLGTCQPVYNLLHSAS